MYDVIRVHQLKKTALPFKVRSHQTPKLQTFRLFLLILLPCAWPVKAFHKAGEFVEWAKASYFIELADRWFYLAVVDMNL